MSSPKVSLYLRKLQKDLPCGNAFNHLYYVGRSYFRVSRSKYTEAYIWLMVLTHHASVSLL